MATIASYPSLALDGSRGAGPGRSLRASRTFRPGDVIARFDDPLLALPHGAASRTICNHCLAFDVTVRPCAGCKAVVYCGGRCQKSNWTLIHKSECKAFQRVKQSVNQDWLPTPVRALVQLLLRWQGEEGVRTSLGSLESNVDKFKTHQKGWDDMGLAAYAGITYSGRPRVDEQLHLARDVLCKVLTNSFDRTDVDTAQGGIFLHPILSMANHSCLPNAYVVFSGRTAVLRASDRVSTGDEINISYIDYNKPRTFRQVGLAAYHFQCTCQRCIHDLNVYRVCSNSAVLSLNSLSLTPDIKQLQKPSQLSTPWSNTLSQEVDETYMAFESESPNQGLPQSRERLAVLRRQWQRCDQLVKLGMWALEPLASTLEYAMLYLNSIGSFADALAIACFTALNCDPYRYPAPFHQRRLKSIMVIAKTLTNTASPQVMAELADKSNSKVVEILKMSDQVTICQALALMVIKHAPLGHSDEWNVLIVARAILEEIESLEGREKETNMLRAWIDAGNEAGTGYFETQVLAPIQDLASVALDILNTLFQPKQLLLKS